MSTWTGVCVVVGYFTILGFISWLLCRALLLWAADAIGQLPWRKMAVAVGLVDDIEWGVTCPACKTYVEWGDIGIDGEQVRAWTCPGCSARVARNDPQAPWSTGDSRAPLGT